MIMSSDNGITIGQLTEQLNQKMDLPQGTSQDTIDYVVEWKKPTEEDPSWYRVYKSGWIEQGGKLTPSASSILTFTFLKAFANNNFTMTTGVIASDKYVKSVQIQNLNSISFSYTLATDGGSLLASPFLWYACGQGA